MIRRPPRSTPSNSSAASDVYKRQVLYDRRMRQFVKPITITVYDWCHIYSVSGLAQHELYNSFQQARGTYGLQYEQVHQYLRLWTWPKACHSPPKDVCNSRRATAHAEKFKASETLDFLPVLKHMVRTLGWETGPMKNEVRSLVALCNVPKFLEGQPTGADAAKLDTLIVSHLKLCLLYTSPSPRDKRQSRMPSSA